MSLPRGSHSNCGSSLRAGNRFSLAANPIRICNVYLASFCQLLESVWAFKNGKPMTAHLFPYACYRSEARVCDTATALRIPHHWLLTAEDPIFSPIF